MRDRKGIACSVTFNIEQNWGLALIRFSGLGLGHCDVFFRRCCSIAGKLRWIFMEIPDPLGVEGFGL